MLILDFWGQERQDWGAGGCQSPPWAWPAPRSVSPVIWPFPQQTRWPLLPMGSWVGLYLWVLAQGWFLCLSCALYKDHPSDFIPVSVKNTSTRDLLFETSSKSLAPYVSLVLLHCVTLFFPISHYVTHFYSNKNENAYNTCINIVYVNIFLQSIYNI